MEVVMDRHSRLVIVQGLAHAPVASASGPHRQGYCYTALLVYVSDKSTTCEFVKRRELLMQDPALYLCHSSSL